MAAPLTDCVSSSAYNAVALAFLLFFYVDLLFLFICAKWLEKLEPDGSPETRSRLRAAFWALATALALAFAWRAGLDMPWPLPVVVWSLSAAVSFGCFYCMFVYTGGDGEHMHAADDVAGYWYWYTIGDLIVSFMITIVIVVGILVIVLSIKFTFDAL